MSDENENSDRRFYYPGGLSDAELHVPKIEGRKSKSSQMKKVFANDEQEFSI